MDVKILSECFENLRPDIFTTFNILICVYIFFAVFSLESTIKGQKEIQIPMSYPVPEVYPYRQREEGGPSAEKHTL